MPLPTQDHLRFMTVFFGANDACLPESPTKQHIPLDQYKQNLKAIVGHPLVVAQEPRIILITPPPVDEHQFQDVTRTAEHTKKYADACRQVASDLGVVVLDLWYAVMSRAGWKEGEDLPGSQKASKSEFLGELLHDGLHFNPKAYQVLYEEMMKTIADNWPDQSPITMPMVLPGWGSAPK
ncbi:hypothetical protein MMC20_000150 [Loxospora ochrophaea]|nr:hypothetical protein [Loxospora ochrophaea]